ncbi:MAG: nucleotide exchange factor GrpE [Clostridia bacterium]|nr:nucleotide exchange factor GrpE [Clostridia bacterium]
MAKKKEQSAEQEEIVKESETAAEDTDRESALRIAQLEKELEEATAKLAETEDRHLRTLAEYDNFKKRSAREKEEIHFLAKSELIAKLLPVFDNFERAQKYSTAEDYASGVDMIVNQFFQILEGMEVRSIAAEGDQFDPNFHEAVFREEKEGVEENTITEVLQKGYAVGDKVIRHAMVKVCM